MSSVPLPSYVEAIGERYPNCFCHAVGDGTVYENIVHDGGDSIPSQAQLDIDRADIQLAKLKIVRLAAIRAKTDELLYNGFVYDGHTFRNTDSARSDYHGMVTFQSMLTWPVALFPISGAQQVYFLELANLTVFMGTVLTHYQNTITVGLQMEGYIRACTSVAEVDAVIDGR